LFLLAHSRWVLGSIHRDSHKVIKKVEQRFKSCPSSSSGINFKLYVDRLRTLQMNKSNDSGIHVRNAGLNTAPTTARWLS